MDPYVAILVTLVFVYLLYKLGSRRGTDSKGEPPSLPVLPVLGSLPFLSKIEVLHLFFVEKAKRYGNVFSFYAGSRYTLVINGYDAIQEALVKRAADFAGREGVYSDKNIWNVGLCGIIYKQYGDGYKFNRAHSLAVLKQFGFGDRRVMESKIQTEVEHLTNSILAKNGVAFNPTDIFGLAALNVIYDLLFSERLQVGDATEMFLRERVHEWCDSVNPLYDLFPLVIYAPPHRAFIKKITSSARQWNDFFRDKIRESAKMEKAGGSNFVVEYVKKVGKDFDEKELVMILRDFIIGGTETTAIQLCWAMILLGNNPKVLERLQTELEAVVPRDRLPSMDDKAKMPYMEATIMEVMRIRMTAPLGVPHMTLCDTELCGYKIPSDAMVLINMWSAHMDPVVWSEPDKFRPERFLDDEGKITNRELMISFFLGKRACIGEVLAVQEMFLFLSALVQQFDILPPEGETSIKDEMKIIRVLTPAPFEVRLVQRA